MKKISLPNLATLGASFVLLAVTGNFALANEAGVLKCRALTDTNKRLACYDATDVTGAVANAKPPAATGGAAGTAAAAGAATTAASVAGAANPRPSGNATTAAPASPAAGFGLPAKQTAVGVDRIETTIKGRLDSWREGSRIRLANGQLWQVADDSRGVCECDNRKVVVTRGAFGTYFLEIEGKGNAPRVKRIE
ncbi:MAG: hypothetical protein H7232_19045 [Aeromicrobium sp.]|nr:hypothetical protein [Burkholderiales bacterium]